VAGAPAELRPVLERALDPDPAARFGTAAELAAAMHAAVGWEDVAQAHALVKMELEGEKRFSHPLIFVL